MVTGGKRKVSSRPLVPIDLRMISFKDKTRSGHYITQFFLFPFCKRSLNCLEGKSMTSIWETLFSSVPPSNFLISVSDPWRAFWADTVPFKGTLLASCIASVTTEKQVQRQVCRTRRGGSRTPSTTIDANLDCGFVENALFYTVSWLQKVHKI